MPQSCDPEKYNKIGDFDNKSQKFMSKICKFFTPQNCDFKWKHPNFMEVFKIYFYGSNNVVKNIWVVHLIFIRLKREV